MRKIKLTFIAVIALAAGAAAFTQDSIPRPAKSVQQLEAQAAGEPGNPSLLHQLGAAYFYQARAGEVAALDKAIANLERSVSLAPGDVAAKRSLGLAYLTRVAYLSRRTPPQEKMAAVQRALSTFEQVLERVPNDPTALSLHGTTLVIIADIKQDRELLAKGIEEMNRAVKENPTSLAANLNRGFTLLNLPPVIRDQKAAISDLEIIPAFCPRAITTGLRAWCVFCSATSTSR